MPRTKSAKKRMKRSRKQRVFNRAFKSKTKTLEKKALKFLEMGDVEKAKEAVAEAIRYLDKAEERGIFHANNVARRKSRLQRKLNELLRRAQASSSS